MLNPWADYNGMRDPGGDNPPPDPSEGGYGPDEQKKQCRDGGGIWIGTGPYGQGYCQQQQEAPTPHQSECPDGQELSPFASDGSDASGNGECVTPEEAQRRFNLRKGKNDSGGGSGGGGSTGTYKPPSTAPTKSPYDAAMSKTLFDTLTNMINGGDAPFGPDTIARLQAAALQSNKSQLGNSRTELQKRLINSGLSRSGVAPASYQKLESAAASDLSGNFRTIATNAVQQNYQARVTALQQAQQFLQSERANSLSQDQLILAYARLNQEWQTTQAQFDQQWKIIQNGNEQEMQKLMICLRTGVC